MTRERMVLEGWSPAERSVLLLLALTGGCGAEQAIEIRYRSEAIRKAATEIKVFVFDAEATCEALDPRGLGPGDAEERTKFIALSKSAGSPKETIAELSDLDRQTKYTLVIEAWGPRCMTPGQSSSDGEPSCSRFATEGALVMRGYTCVPLDFEASSADITLDMDTFALISSSMSVPNLTPPAKALHYDAEQPLPIVDGIEGIDRFLVQLLDHKNEAANDVKVHWGIIDGSGSFDVETSLSYHDDAIGDGGFSVAVLRAAANASLRGGGGGGGGGKITAYAYAPGYEGAPIVFEARAVPAIEVDLKALDVPATMLPVEGTDSELRPVVIDDLDGNGKGDIVFHAGSVGSCATDGRYQLVVLYQDEAGTLSALTSPVHLGELRNFTTARLSPGANPSLFVSLSDSCARLTSVNEEIPGIPDPRTYILQGARIGLFAELDGFIPEPRVFRDLIRCDAAEQCAPVPMTKSFLAVTAADIDGDGIDELATTRCSYVYYSPRVSGVPVSQSSRVFCHGDLADRSDSELALLTADFDANNELVGFRERAAIEEEGGDGGFREVQLEDINGDLSPDLVFATQTEVGTICGRRNMPETGYGFGSLPPPPRADTPITFAQGYSVGVGRFDADEIADVVTTGALRAASPNAGVKMNPSRGCMFDVGEDAVIIGPRTSARRMILRVADLNLDGFDDVVVLHRDAHEITTLFGNGTEVLARGPRVVLPGGPTSELGLYVEARGEVEQTTMVATVSASEGRVFVVRFKPRK